MREQGHAAAVHAGTRHHSHTDACAGARAAACRRARQPGEAAARAGRRLRPHAAECCRRHVEDGKRNLAKDVVYDLGSGDGRIPITAAQKYGARGVGIDINPERIKEANANLAKASVGDKVRFLNQDLFETDLSPATVITLYLLPTFNQKLIPKLKALKPGTRIVSHSFDMGTEWPPEKTEDVQGRMIYYWTIK